MGLRGKFGKNTGAIIGTAIAPGLGTYIGASMDSQKRAQQEMDDALAANQNTVAGEMMRRNKNINDARAMYGQAGPGASADQIRTSQVMGSKLNRDIQGAVQAGSDLSAQQNLGAASQNLKAANAAAAASGNYASAHKRNLGSVMGSYLSNRQNIAGNAMGMRQSAVENLANQRFAMEGAVGGGLDINPILAANQAKGDMRAAKAGVYTNAIGSAAGQIAGNNMLPIGGLMKGGFG